MKLLVFLTMFILVASFVSAETWQVDNEYTFNGHLTVINTPVMRIQVGADNIWTQRSMDEGFYIHTRTASYSSEEGGNGNTLIGFPRKIESNAIGYDIYIGSHDANPYVRFVNESEGPPGGTYCSGAQTRFGSMFALGANDINMYGFSLDGWLGEYDLATCALTEYDMSGFFLDQIIDADATYIYGDDGVVRISDKAVVTPGGAVGLDHNNPTYFDDLYLYGFDGAGNYRVIDKATYTEQTSIACDGGTCAQFITDFQTGNAYYSLDDAVHVLTPGTWSTSEVELLDNLGDPLTLDLIDGIDFYNGKAFVKTYVAGPTHKIYEMSRTLCEPDWSCNGYETCVSPMTEAECTSVEDLNACGESYTGNYSEFSADECTYINSGSSGGVTALSVIALEPEGTEVEVTEPDESVFDFFDKYNTTQKIIIGTLVIGVIAGIVAIANMIMPKGKAKQPRRRRRK